MNRLKGAQIPQPYHDLLVHSRDMTPTLQRFYRHPIGLDVINRHHEAKSYFREVVLNAAGNPVEYGMIRIALDLFPAIAQKRILEEKTPLGAILLEEGLAHFGWPQAFFAVRSDAQTSHALALHESCLLYGRRNVLLDGDRRLLAEVVEILAPV